MVLRTELSNCYKMYCVVVSILLEISFYYQSEYCNFISARTSHSYQWVSLRASKTAC